MQVIIDIPETTYNIIKEDVRFVSEKRSDEQEVYLAIKNGIVIPDNAKNGDVLSLMGFKELTGEISHILEIDDYDRTTLEKEWLNASYNR